MKRSQCAALLLLALQLGQAQAQSLPPVGQWDGKTLTGKLNVPYEDPHQTPPNFGIISYFNQPWRGYMDTHPASKWLNFPGAGWNGDDKYAEAMAQLMNESGIRFARIEVGWGSLTWDDELPAHIKESLGRRLRIFQKNGIRPLILLNAHHGVPGPLRNVEVELVQDAGKGERVLKLKPGTKVREGYTGPPHSGDYKAAYPLITKLDEDGTAHLSAPLPGDHKTGKMTLQELKYQPFQGTRLKDAAPVAAAPVAAAPIAAAQETFDGWLKYAAAIGNFARQTLSANQSPDSGFDIEVWNELTFGSDFLDINNYFEPKREYAEPFTYRKRRAWTPALRPDAQLEFKQEGAYAILPMTVDFFNDPKNGFKGVNVLSGFSNQWPWNSGEDRWDGQAGLSRHFYTGTDVKDVSPNTQLGSPKSATVDALGSLDGKKAPGDWHSIEPNSNFVPRFQMSLPEFFHSGFKTETSSRDLFPDSRRSGTPAFMGRHGRYTTNGELRKMQYWQTEVNYDRSGFIGRIRQQSGAKEDDARLLALNDWTNSKHMLRQYIFHCHKGFDRIFLFSLDFNELEIGLLPRAFFKALDADNYQLTPAVRRTIPPGWNAVKWISNLMKSGQNLEVTRPLRVDALVEHKPRLVFAGDGTPAHPHKWNRDFFAFLPFQLTAQKFAIPYYVVFPNATHAWDSAKDPLDPARYDMPDQEFDVTIGNLAGRGARVAAYDPLKGRSVPAQIVASTPNSLTVRVKATDYPRVLQVEEARPGPLILNPRIAATGNNQVTVSWQTNIPINAAKVTYGRDWTQRGANEIAVVAHGKTTHTVRLPTGDADMLAVRIKVAANGLSDEWPRWDEEPAGQFVLPNAKPRAASASAAPANAAPSGPATPLIGPDNVILPVIESNAHGFTLRLPQGALVSGPPDDRTIMLGRGEAAITLRVRAIAEGAKNAHDYLPFQGLTDTIERRAVTLQNGAAGTLADYTLNPLAYPGVTKTRQKYLLLPIGPGKADLLVLAALGTPRAMQAQSKIIDAIFAGINVAGP